MALFWTTCVTVASVQGEAIVQVGFGMWVFVNVALNVDVDVAVTVTFSLLSASTQSSVPTEIPVMSSGLIVCGPGALTVNVVVVTPHTARGEADPAPCTIAYRVP